MATSNRALALFTVVATLVMAAALVLFLNLPESPPSNLNASIVVRKLETPVLAYAITPQDLVQFPVIASVFEAYANPNCCPNTRMEDGILVFEVSEQEGLLVSSYLRDKYEMLQPDPRIYDIAIEYESEYFEWSYLVQVRGADGTSPPSNASIDFA